MMVAGSIPNHSRFTSHSQRLSQFWSLFRIRFPLINRWNIFRLFNCFAIIKWGIRRQMKFLKSKIILITKIWHPFCPTVVYWFFFISILVKNTFKFQLTNLILWRRWLLLKTILIFKRFLNYSSFLYFLNLTCLNFHNLVLFLNRLLMNRLFQIPMAFKFQSFIRIRRMNKIGIKRVLTWSHLSLSLFG